MITSGLLAAFSSNFDQTGFTALGIVLLCIAVFTAATSFSYFSLQTERAISKNGIIGGLVFAIVANIVTLSALYFFLGALYLTDTYDSLTADIPVPPTGVTSGLRAFLETAMIVSIFCVVSIILNFGLTCSTVLKRFRGGLHFLFGLMIPILGFLLIKVVFSLAA